MYDVTVRLTVLGDTVAEAMAEVEYILDHAREQYSPNSEWWVEARPVVAR